MRRSFLDRKRVLLVDTSPAHWRDHLPASELDLEIEICTEFTAARKSLLRNPPEFLITNLRLGEYNGLHLVYLALGADFRTRAIMYGTLDDLALIREAQRLGAFFESQDRVLAALRSYVQAALPARDRRTPAEMDRRLAYRGGRRATDLPKTS